MAISTPELWNTGLSWFHVVHDVYRGQYRCIVDLDGYKEQFTMADWADREAVIRQAFTVHRKLSIARAVAKTLTS
jgi:hypothetical protein